MDLYRRPRQASLPWADLHPTCQQPQGHSVSWHMYEANCRKAESRLQGGRCLEGQKDRNTDYGGTVRIALNQRPEEGARWQRRRRHWLRESNWVFQDRTCPAHQAVGQPLPGARLPRLGPHRRSSPRAHGASSLPASYLSSSHLCTDCTLLGLTTSLLPAFCSL